MNKEEGGSEKLTSRERSVSEIAVFTMVVWKKGDSQLSSEVGKFRRCGK